MDRDVWEKEVRENLQKLNEEYPDKIRLRLFLNKNDPKNYIEGMYDGMDENGDIAMITDFSPEPNTTGSGWVCETHIPISIVAYYLLWVMN